MTAAGLAERIVNLANDRDLLARMALNACRLGRPGAAESIAEICREASHGR